MYVILDGNDRFLRQTDDWKDALWWRDYYRTLDDWATIHLWKDWIKC